MKILIVKTSSLGDIIHSFPVVDYLRRKFPEATIDWVVEAPFAELVRANPQVDGVITCESKKWRKALFNKKTWQECLSFYRQLKKKSYDLLFDLQGNVKSSAIVLSCRAQEKVGFGWQTVREWPNVFFTTCKINPSPGKNIREDYLALAQGFFKDTTTYHFHPMKLKLEPLQEQKLAELFPLNMPQPTLVCPSSTWSNKCLSEEALIQLLKKMDKGPYWFVWGNLEERSCALKLSAHFAGSVVLERLSLPLLQHVMTKCKLVVAMDSLPLHLCGTTDTPTLSFFGPSSAKKFAPIGDIHNTVQGTCPYGVHFEKTCPKLRTCPTGLCLKGKVDSLDNGS